MPGGISFDRVSTLYDGTRSLPEGVVREVTEPLIRELGTGWILEIGVGTGRWAWPLQRGGVQLAGVDLSRSMLAVARSKGVRSLVQGDVLRLPYRGGAFAGALSNHLLHLVFDVPAVMQELSRVATGRLHSVLEFETERPEVNRRYRELAVAGGTDTSPPGMGERDLSRRLRPDRRRVVCTFYSRQPAEVLLDSLERRSFRDTWVPSDELHQAILGELREQFEGTEVTTETRVEIASWELERIRDFAETWRRAGRAPPEASESSEEDRTPAA